MDKKTELEYQNAISKYQSLIKELEAAEDWETAQYYKENLIEIKDELEYLKSDENVFQAYLDHINKTRNEIGGSIFEQ